MVAPVLFVVIFAGVDFGGYFASRLSVENAARVAVRDSTVDVCPTTLQTLGGASDQLGPKAKQFQVVFITVDPERDTPKQLNDYLTSAAYSRGVVGLTGSDDQIAAVTKAYGVYSQKQGTGADYTVNHSSAIYLMNPKGQFDSVIPYGLTPDQVRERLVKAMRENDAGS